MTSQRVIPCQARGCARFLGYQGIPEFTIPVCEAFPKGIPQDIIGGTNLHLKKHSGDGGLTFVPSKRVTGAELP